MYINHSCDPNCETDEIDGKVWIIAARNIKAGEELAYDYNLYDGEENDPAICECGARGCRGTMYSEEEVADRKKADRRKQKPKKKGLGKSTVTKKQNKKRNAAAR
jgi:uncharacterized protein